MSILKQRQIDAALRLLGMTQCSQVTAQVVAGESPGARPVERRVDYGAEDSCFVAQGLYYSGGDSRCQKVIAKVIASDTS